MNCVDFCYKSVIYFVVNKDQIVIITTMIKVKCQPAIDNSVSKSAWNKPIYRWINAQWKENIILVEFFNPWYLMIIFHTFQGFFVSSRYLLPKIG